MKQAADLHTLFASRLVKPSCLVFQAGLLAVAVQAAEAPRHRFDPKIELPDTNGKALVLRACTQCHELAGLDAYKGYWSRAQWKEMVVGMVKHGAPLLPAEQEQVADYLTRHFGPGTRRD